MPQYSQLSPIGAVKATIITSSSTTDSTSSTTGAAVFAGGVGIAKSLHVGGGLSSTGPLSLPTAALAALGTGAALNTAAPIVTMVSVVSAASSSTVGVALPAATLGAWYRVYNTSAQTLKVWPQAADTIDAVGSHGAVSLSTTHNSDFVCTTANQWTSTMLGATAT